MISIKKKKPEKSVRRPALVPPEISISVPRLPYVPLPAVFF